MDQNVHVCFQLGIELWAGNVVMNSRLCGSRTLAVATGGQLTYKLFTFNYNNCYHSRESCYVLRSIVGVSHIPHCLILLSWRMCYFSILRKNELCFRARGHPAQTSINYMWMASQNWLPSPYSCSSSYPTLIPEIYTCRICQDSKS